MDYNNIDDTHLWSYQWDLIHDPQTMLFAWAQGEEEGAYETDEVIAKILQEIRCAYLDGMSQIELSYLERSHLKRKVNLVGTDYDFFLDYNKDKPVTLSSSVTVIKGNYDLSSWWEDYMGEYIPQNFQYKCELGGLTIYTSMQDFAAYINPTEARIKSDFTRIWENINTKDGISQDEFLKLKSVAACATRYLTANDRYNLIKKLSVGTIWETKEDLILDLFETAGSSSDFDAFMDLIAGDARLFKQLYSEMNNANMFTKEENKTRFLNTMFALWSSSDYSQHGHSSYTYNESSPYVISYMPEGYPRSYAHSYTFSISDSKLKIDEYLDPEFYSESGHTYYDYHIFQPIRVVFADEDDKVMFPGGDIPAFYLMGVDEVADCKSLMNAFSLQFDVALALTGVGNLTHLKNIPKGYRLVKITIAAVEISSSVADIIMNYTNACNGSEEFCNELREYTFWLQVASLSGDVLFTRMMNKSAKKVLAKIDDSGLDAADNANLRSHLEDVAGASNVVDNLLEKGIKNLTSGELLKIAKESTTSITNKTIITNTIDAASANMQFTGQQIRRFGQNIDLSKVNPPHSDIPNIGVNDFKLLEKKYFVRVSNSTNSAFGEWLISLEDFKKFKSADEIKDALALPVKPTHFNLAEIPQGTIVRESQVAKVWQEGAYWGNGGVKQYQIQEFWNKGESVVKGWFSEVQGLNNFFE